MIDCELGRRDWQFLKTVHRLPQPACIRCHFSSDSDRGNNQQQTNETEVTGGDASGVVIEKTPSSAVHQPIEVN